MRRYNRIELIKFLRGMDEELSAPVQMLIIGGAAASLRYGATSTTRDIDTWTTIPPAIHQAADRARAKTGLEIPLEQASVADAPYHYEDRTRRMPLKLRWLRVRVPERHDLVLMKIIRGDRHDEDVIAEIHAKHPWTRHSSSTASRTRWDTSSRTSGSCGSSSGCSWADCSDPMRRRASGPGGCPPTTRDSERNLLVSAPSWTGSRR